MVGFQQMFFFFSLPLSSSTQQPLSQVGKPKHYTLKYSTFLPILCSCCFSASSSPFVELLAILNDFHHYIICSRKERTTSILPLYPWHLAQVHNNYQITEWAPSYLLFECLKKIIELKGSLTQLSYLTGGNQEPKRKMT